MFRIKQSQPWYSRYQWQHIYVPLVAFPLLVHKMRYDDYAILKTLRRGVSSRVMYLQSFDCLVSLQDQFASTGRQCPT